MVRSIQNIPLQSNASISAPRQAAVDCPMARDDRHSSQEEPRNGVGQGGNREKRHPGGQPSFLESLPPSQTIGMGRGLIPPHRRGVGLEFVRPVGHGRGRGEGHDVHVPGQVYEANKSSLGLGLGVPKQDESYDDGHDGDGYGSAVDTSEEEEGEFEDPDPEEEGDMVEDTILRGDEIDPRSIKFKEVMSLVARMCPHAISDSNAEPLDRCETEGIFIPAPPTYRDSSRLKMFARFKKARAKVATLVSDIACDPDRSFNSLLAHSRGIYHCADDDSVFRPPKPNASLCRLGGSKISKKTCVSVSMKDLVQIESAFYSMAETQSFEMWLVSTLLKCLREVIDPGENLAMFERLCSVFSGASVRLHVLGAKAAAFVANLRRSLYLAHMPPTVMPDQKNRLLASDPFSGRLFDPDVLAAIISEHQGDVVSFAHVKLANTLDKIFPSVAVAKKRKRKTPPQVGPPQGAALQGSPLTGPPSSSSTAVAPSFAGQKYVKGGRGRGGRGRGGYQQKGNPKMSGNPGRGFQA